MKVLLLCGNAPNHLALAHKIKQKHQLVGLVVESKVQPNTFWSISTLISKVLNRLIFRKLDATWSCLMADYLTSYPGLPDAPILKVSDINSQEVIAFAENSHADLIAVSGTSIIKKNLFQVKPKKGIINLHTGLSPYVRGGPNCSNWCISNDEVHLIGNTVMWLNEGIDSGNIIASAAVPLSGDEKFLEMHEKIMEHAHQLYLDTIDALDLTFTKCQSVKQKDIDIGNLYISKMWNHTAKSRLLQNIKNGSFRTAIQSEEYTKKQSELIYVNLPN